MESSGGQIFRRRSGLITVCFLFWGFLALSCVFSFSVVKSDELRAQARRTAWRQGEIPALRGTLFSSKGKILAESRLGFVLRWESEKAGKAVGKILGRDVSSGCEISEKELSDLEPLIRNMPFALKIESREIRSGSPAAEKFERKYDEILRGRNGLFVVMLDRFGRIVPGTMKIVREQIPGRPVVLKADEEAEL